MKRIIKIESEKNERKKGRKEMNLTSIINTGVKLDNNRPTTNGFEEISWGFCGS
jgi:hypothetical protein